MMGVIDGVRDPTDRGVVCWKEEEGKYFYDTTRKAYAPQSESFGFAAIFNSWLEGQGLEHLILVRPLTPDNSKVCPLGFLWDKIPSPGHCTWNYETDICYPSACWVSDTELKARIEIAEGRCYSVSQSGYSTKPMNSHEGD
jgi:hypothetical protein